MKKISVIMGIYNCEETLSESVESIINQTYENWELIMCDDCSKDRTYEIAKEYERKYPDKIKVLKNDKNLTLGPTLNKCLEKANGDYIARQDGDDKSILDRLEKQVKFLNDNSKYALVGTKMISFSKGGIKGERGIKESIPTIKNLLSSEPFIHPTIMVRKEVYNSLNGYRTNSYTQRAEDLDMWFRFFKKGYKGYNLSEALYMVRDDGSEYVRRNFRNYFNDFRTRAVGYRLLNISWIYYPRLLKPFFSYMMPLTLMKYYHRKYKISK